MFTGINGDTLYRRIQELASVGKELMVTEFDIEDFNAVRKAEDLEDFMRIAFSHPQISMILTWKWLKIGRNKNWEKTFWEGDFGTDAVSKPEVCDDQNFVCNYPLNPNAAGVRWLELVKGEWNSSMTFAATDTDVVPMFHGDYTIALIDADENEIKSFNITVDKATCDLYGESNLLFNGDFETLDGWQDQGSAWIQRVPSWRAPELKPGMVGAGMYVFASEHDIFVLQNLTMPLQAGTTYHTQFYAKLFDAEMSIAQIIIYDGSGESIHYINGGINEPGNTDWTSADGSFVATGDEKAIAFSLHGGVSNGGDALFDHAYLVTDEDYQSCTQYIDLFLGKPF